MENAQYGRFQFPLPFSHAIMELPTKQERKAMDNAPKPNNKRSTTTGKLELRKLWSVPKAEFIYALFVEVKTETAEMKDGEPDWDKITDTELSWQTPQGYIGDEDWAKKTAEHFEIEFPKEEYKAE